MASAVRVVIECLAVIPVVEQQRSDHIDNDEPESEPKHQATVYAEDCPTSVVRWEYFVPSVLRTDMIAAAIKAEGLKRVKGAKAALMRWLMLGFYSCCFLLLNRSHSS